MKSTFLFLVTTTMMTCTALGQPSNDKKNVLPDWAFGGFERPQGANPVISPIEDTKFYCPMTQDYVAWESNDTFNPAATLHDGKIVVLYRAEDKSGYRRHSRRTVCDALYAMEPPHSASGNSHFTQSERLDKARSRFCQSV